MRHLSCLIIAQVIRQRGKLLLQTSQALSDVLPHVNKCQQWIRPLLQFGKLFPQFHLFKQKLITERWRLLQGVNSMLLQQVTCPEQRALQGLIGFVDMGSRLHRESSFLGGSTGETIRMRAVLQLAIPLHQGIGINLVCPGKTKQLEKVLR